MTPPDGDRRVRVEFGGGGPLDGLVLAGITARSVIAATSIGWTGRCWRYDDPAAAAVYTLTCRGPDRFVAEYTPAVSA